MKRTGTILFTACLALSSLTFQPAFSQDTQDKTKEDKERELRMQEAIDAQKKAISEQKKAQAEAQVELDKAKRDMEKALQDYKFNFQLDSTKHFERAFRNFPKNFNRDLAIPYINGDQFIFDHPDMPFMGQWYAGDGEHTAWDFSKSLKENSYSGDYPFDVEQTASNVVMSVNGDCKKGDIRIKIVSPNGKTYSDIVIDEFGNLNWRKSFNISDEENKDKTGAWKFHISASKATGYFKISLQTW